MPSYKSKMFGQSLARASNPKCLDIEDLLLKQNAWTKALLEIQMLNLIKGVALHPKWMKKSLALNPTCLSKVLLILQNVWTKYFRWIPNDCTNCFWPDFLLYFFLYIFLCKHSKIFWKQNVCTHTVLVADLNKC